MNTRLLSIALITTFAVAACVSSRSKTHWIVNNDSDKELSLNLKVYAPGSNHQTVKTHTVKPGLHELKAETFSKGTYSIVAGTDDGTVTSSRNLHFDSESWVIINFTNSDSADLKRRLGYIDTTVLKKIDGKYTGMDIFRETRKPPFLYNVIAGK